jgi:peptidoglycan/LPS O-acetylase OafA/YrhL
MSRTPAIGSRSNNFDVLRLAAAAAVLLSHAFLLTGRDDPVIAITGEETIGDIAVTAFFGISGFLVARSWCREPNVARFFVKRALRILPALLAVVVLCAFVLGPLVTTVPLGEYFGTSAPWSYVGGNAAFQTSLYLPGVFQANAHDSVNGALWTLPIELEAYLAVAVLGILGAFRRARTVALVAAVLLVLDLPLGPDGGALATGFISTSMAGHIVNRLAAFFVAALLYVLRDRDVVRGRVAAALALAWLAAVATPLGYVVGAVAIPYCVVYLAYRTPAALGRLTRHGDVSYGVYVWGWPVGHTVFAVAGPSLGPLGLIAIAGPFTYLVALASWRLVEAPALRLKTGRQRLQPAPARA